MKMNSRMTELLNAGATGFVPARFGLFVDAGFKEVDGCYFFLGRSPANPNVLKQYPDRTACECAINKAEVTDYLDSDAGADPAVLSALGMSSAAYVARKLATQSKRPFIVIVSVGERNCTLRFHARRPGEKYLTEDLDHYQGEAIGVLDTSAL